MIKNNINTTSRNSISPQYRKKHRQLPQAPESTENDGNNMSPYPSPHLSPNTLKDNRPYNYNALVTPTLRSKISHSNNQTYLLNPNSIYFDNNTIEMSPGQPLRSQSFRHRHRPLMEVKKNIHEDNINNGERRKSTPNISRRYSLQKGRIDLVRTDVWAQPKTRSEIEERFLKLPDSEDYTRVRQFKIDAKGAVVSRGDSFRRKKNNKNENSPSPFETESSRGEGNDSRSGSIGSTESTKLIQSDPLTNSNTSGTDSQMPSTSVQSYKICIVGSVGTGKSSLISQFITSEYRNTFVCETEYYDNHVSVCIDGHECELIFYEDNLQDEEIWKKELYHAYVLVYGIDSKSSFRKAMNAIDDIREINKNVPIILTGNKADLERKRNVARNDVKSVIFQYNIPHFEISVALNHDVDDLLVAIIAEIRESRDCYGNLKVKKDNIENTFGDVNLQEHDDFKAAIRRFSQRKKKQMGHIGVTETQTPKCSSFNPVGLIERFRQWRKGST
ncbi:Small GTPase superfamily and Small GTPase superfamily, Rab type and Small GTPase superfamily, Ras type and P-loop containing nucleoside triphosphate hydrolase domain-containing protein [Strongyloides ratti]|uniref:Small GTPase superfamily and Small GTPase superfamily, Rab type and Small GTPase superfamily, Ras type and P-loop containing nucleoside triphosphate hydrolase domain-containing protein n=1 Tax=Strongyloides ratti TaxID=34506 RepID=A0A090LF44_STRRB|nr:Small GTPase superfamily and Small GTPase superfamily, Rab type and Small GTPase superfamily, Ras type and P-loop containing nucleoside triphosphate hydrolase domain-containing protein [Strongyloides ratti]CEF68416.1 Small GTPase superfamily and Small GTPase superfamily, Rab type and Small GTPase superfamily, Ras type and P-loop containing nucleoside triphosphate hydrolase domain-containing protein [Strongyloides ratti]